MDAFVSHHHRADHNSHRAPQEKDHRRSSSSHRHPHHYRRSRSRSPRRTEDDRRKTEDDRRKRTPEKTRQTLSGAHQQQQPIQRPIQSAVVNPPVVTTNQRPSSSSSSGRSSASGSVQSVAVVKIQAQRPLDPLKRPLPPASKMPVIPKKQKLSTAPTPTPPARIRPASFLVPPLPNGAPTADPAALQNYPRKLSMEQMTQRYRKAAEEKKKLEEAQKKKQMIPAMPNRKKIPPPLLPKRKAPATVAEKPKKLPVPSSTASVDNSSHQSIYSSDADSRPQSVASFFDEIEALPQGDPVLPAPVDQPVEEERPAVAAEPETEFNQIRVDRWQKGFDKSIYTVSHSQGKAKEQLNLPLLEDNEEIISIVNKGRHVMSVRPGPVETALVDFRSVIRVFKKGSPVVHDVFFKPKPDLSVEVKDLEKIASWCHNWLKSGKR